MDHRKGGQVRDEEQIEEELDVRRGFVVLKLGIVEQGFVVGVQGSCTVHWRARLTRYLVLEYCEILREEWSAYQRGLEQGKHRDSPSLKADR